MTVAAGSTATFKVTASGSSLSYQWQYYGSDGTWHNITNTAYSGRTSATMSVTGTAARNGLKLRCKVSNSGGTVYSGTATLTVK